MPTRGRATEQYCDTSSLGLGADMGSFTTLTPNEDKTKRGWALEDRRAFSVLCLKKLVKTAFEIKLNASFLGEILVLPTDGTKQHSYRRIRTTREKRIFILKGQRQLFGH